MESQLQNKRQKQVDEAFLNLVEESVKRDEKLLKKLAKA